MAIPDYFGRNAVAIAQVISGLDEERLSAALSDVRVGITIGRDARGFEGRALLDLLVRLVSRLYPTVAFRADHDNSVCDDARDLASRINPNVELTGKPTVELVVGSTRLRSWAPQRIFVGSTAWTAAVSTSRPQPCGYTEIPFGAGAAACLGAANLFRHVFLPESRLDADATFAILGAEEPSTPITMVRAASGDLALAGAGAIGNAAAWALARTPVTGALAIVDHETVDLGNLQRYVLTERSDEGHPKPAVLARHFKGSLAADPNCLDLASFIVSRSHQIDRLLLALDSARDRRLGQASLPRWVANAWTQPGDLGVSIHDFLNGACVCCLYLPDRALMNEDGIIAQAFGVPDRIMEIRLLLHNSGGAPRGLLEAIATAREVPLDRLLPFEGRPVRTLYTEGFCGGAVIPLSQIGAPRSDVHVPLAHQSALAGVLLAAAAVRNIHGGARGSQITQLDVLKPMPAFPSRPAAKDPRGICICQDVDYRDAYMRKFGGIRTRATGGPAPSGTSTPAPKRSTKGKRKRS
ncbi:MAG: E2 ligase fold family C protein, partial [Steroidobacteraceae bacterium]